MIKLIGYLKLVRWFHEVVAILPFTALYFVITQYIEQAGIACSFSGWNVTLICFCFQLLIAAGCVLNDIVDRHIDKVNKPNTRIIDRIISLREAQFLFWILTVLYFLLSIYISANVLWEWSIIAIVSFFLSLSYDLYFKQSPLLGNILMGILTAFMPLMFFIIAEDCLQLLQDDKVTLLIIIYAFYPFFIIIARELSLDISDMEGDKAGGCKTLPILIGVRKSKFVVTFFLVVILAISIPLILKFTYLTTSFLIVDGLLIYYLYQLWKVEERIEYIRIGRFLWFIMILGLILFTVATCFQV